MNIYYAILLLLAIVAVGEFRHRYLTGLVKACQRCLSRCACLLDNKNKSAQSLMR